MFQKLRFDVIFVCFNPFIYIIHVVLNVYIFNNEFDSNLVPDMFEVTENERKTTPH